jgi:hypothetical protein
LPLLRAVCEEVAARHDVRTIAAVHAVGQLDVGSPAVVVAAAADHRGAAFEAARDLIDTVKSEVPMWKHQAFGDGTTSGSVRPDQVGELVDRGLDVVLPGREPPTSSPVASSPGAAPRPTTW